ncbi:DUF418 domain-containing protein [Nosocomiicoccus ampullae]|uniref:DUF418 domain-containing protein n=1 Tax=Nosocomiicoccus ampullae TaxID=489910 RepID=UPI001C5E8D54|nr:DUF418 domain-containing protein [Nosocomiicoccus ampullae]QYA49037.1 DUF418 domain-containing protein [Nosocomiicoccus ampullae]
MKRIKVVDSLRGFSLLGILLANLLVFNYGMFGNQYPEVYDVSKIGQFLIQAIRVLFEGSTMPIFAFLFGFGMYIMASSFKRKDLGVKRGLIRRGMALLLFGALHAVFLFEGDILFAYGLMTLVLFWLPSRSLKTMIVCLILSLSLVILMHIDFGGVEESVDESSQYYSEELTEEQIEYLLEEKEAYRTLTTSERRLFLFDSDNPFLGGGIVGYIFTYILIISFYVPVFISGMIAAKLKMFETGGMWKKALVILVPIGIILNIYALNNETLDFYMFFIDTALAFGYIGLFYYVYKENLFMDSLAAVGKLSLTNYILQSVFHSFIYYGNGFGRFGDSNFTLSFTLAIMFFIVQVIFSHYYMKKFKYGPLEYLLRIWTYFSFKPHLKRGKHPQI